MNRRYLIHRVGQASAFMALSPTWAASLKKPSKSEHDAIREAAEGFLREHNIPGLAIAYGRNGTIALEAGFGFADADGKEVVTPEHRFRIASVSKPITATAVMMCAEKGQLKLDDKVFGPQGILGGDYGPEVTAITVDHLLTHASGGWTNDKDDPMFKNPAMKHDELIAWTLKNQIQPHPAGSHFAYSNFGYCVLGRVLEKVAKLPYETLLTQHVLPKCGVTSMKIAGNTLAERQEKEMIYHDEKAELPYGMQVARMDSHGGWIATAGDLVRFASQLPNLLKRESIRTMTTAGVSENYARGWSVNESSNWWHAGSLPGTTSIMLHTASGVCWAGLINKRTEAVSSALDKLMWQLAGLVSSWDL